MFRWFACGWAICLLASSCALPRPAYVWSRHVERSAVFSRGITGFVLLDAHTGQCLAQVRSDRPFTPASNTKILTLAASLQLLPDTLPALQVQPLVTASEEEGRRWLVRGMSSPVFLHPQFQSWQSALDSLRQYPGALWLCPPPERLQRFGPGWAWDDYLEDFQPERGALPVYGHLIHVHQYAPGLLEVWPPRFRDSCRIDVAVARPERPEQRNQWRLPPVPDGGQQTYWLPFVPHSLPSLLADTLGKAVDWLPDSLRAQVPSDGWQTLWGAPLDTVLRRMMHQSDNFIAEHLLLLCGQERFGTLRTDTLIRWLLDSVWADLPQRPHWVDGSGLSRYNLISPRTIAHLLLQLWRHYPRERLFHLFPAGGRDGTIARWYAPAPGETPWLFAKTGTLSGVHCLSGYLVARSGRVLVFSFMHTNFIGSNTPWKREMERLLRRIHESY